MMEQEGRGATLNGLRFLHGGYRMIWKLLYRELRTPPMGFQRQHRWMAVSWKAVRRIRFAECKQLLLGQQPGNSAGRFPDERKTTVIRIKVCVLCIDAWQRLCSAASVMLMTSTVYIDNRSYKVSGIRSEMGRTVASGISPMTRISLFL